MTYSIVYFLAVLLMTTHIDGQQADGFHEGEVNSENETEHEISLNSPNGMANFSEAGELNNGNETKNNLTSHHEEEGASHDGNYMNQTEYGGNFDGTDKPENTRNVGEINNVNETESNNNFTSHHNGESASHDGTYMNQTEYGGNFDGTDKPENTKDVEKQFNRRDHEMDNVNAGNTEEASYIETGSGSEAEKDNRTFTQLDIDRAYHEGNHMNETDDDGDFDGTDIPESSTDVDDSAEHQIYKTETNGTDSDSHPGDPSQHDIDDMSNEDDIAENQINKTSHTMEIVQSGDRRNISNIAELMNRTGHETVMSYGDNGENPIYIDEGDIIQEASDGITSSEDEQVTNNENSDTEDTLVTVRSDGQCVRNSQLTYLLAISIIAVEFI